MVDVVDAELVGNEQNKKLDSTTTSPWRNEANTQCSLAEVRSTKSTACCVM